LPWDTLSSDPFLTHVIEELAPEVRSGRSSVPLVELQEFVVRFAPEDLRKGYGTAVYLIGITDTPGQTQLLERIILEDVHGLRARAILALGHMCSEEADNLLVSIKESTNLPEADKARAAAMLDFRRGPRVRAWCSRSRGTASGIT
jgi:HEAT repeat protein